MNFMNEATLKKCFFSFTVLLYSLMTILTFINNPFVKIEKPKTESNIKNDFFYFIQITDTHFSYNKRKNFDKFIDYVNLLDPSFLIHTGDITHGINEKRQCYSSEKDFHFYFDNLKRLKCDSFSLRGNHDTFGNQNNKYFDKRSFYKIINDCLFIFLDGTLKSKPKGILNFFGFFDDEKFLNEIPKQNFGKIFLCTHYPSNTLISNFTINADVILAGHLHNYGPLIYKRHKNDVLELVGKHYKEGRFRICAMDDGIFSFNDYDFDKKPKILILSPTDENFVTGKQNKETLKIMQFFSDEVVVYVDNKLFYKITSPDKFISINLPKIYKEISVKGINKEGENIHKILLKKSANFWTTIDIPFKWLPTLFLVLFFILLYFNNKKNDNTNILIRMNMRMILPNAYLKLFNEKYVFLCNFGCTDNSYERFLFFISFSYFLELFLFLSNFNFYFLLVIFCFMLCIILCFFLQLDF